MVGAPGGRGAPETREAISIFLTYPKEQIKRGGTYAASLDLADLGRPRSDGVDEPRGQSAARPRSEIPSSLKYNRVINTKAAKALGLTVPPRWSLPPNN